MYCELKLECQTYPGSLGSSRMCRCLSTTNQNQFRMYDWRCPKIESCMVRLYVIQKNNAIHLHFILFFLYFFFHLCFVIIWAVKSSKRTKKCPITINYKSAMTKRKTFPRVTNQTAATANRDVWWVCVQKRRTANNQSYISFGIRNNENVQSRRSQQANNR